MIIREEMVEHFTCFPEGYVKAQGDLLEFTQQIVNSTENNRKYRLLLALPCGCLYVLAAYFLDAEMACLSPALSINF